MNNIVNFPIEGAQSYRDRFSFVCRNTRIKDEYGPSSDTYPCIVLLDTSTNIPVSYTGYEKFIQPLTVSEINKGSTLSRKGMEICRFLNYMLHETKVDKICDLTLNDIRNALIHLKVKNENGEEYAKSSWEKMCDSLYAFLRNYYIAYSDKYDFKFDVNVLHSYNIFKDEKTNKKTTIVTENKLGVRPPVTTHKKNRVLVYGYLQLFLYEAMKYDPMLTLAMALQSYAGLREGEVVNLTCGRVKEQRGGFERLVSIELDLTSDAPFWVEYKGKTNPASFKKNQHRIQKVYDDFLKDILNLYNEHIMMLEAKGYDTSNDAPLFVSDFGKPMTVQTYTRRVKQLFYAHFLPSLKQTCIVQNTWAENAAFLEIYEKEYPGAHMFRHWFTMYLLTKAHLEQGEIIKWRNDHSAESMASYIHENSDLINIYENSAYRFQAKILEEIEAKYGS